MLSQSKYASINSSSMISLLFKTAAIISRLKHSPHLVLISKLTPSVSLLPFNQIRLLRLTAKLKAQLFQSLSLAIQHFRAQLELCKMPPITNSMVILRYGNSIHLTKISFS